MAADRTVLLDHDSWRLLRSPRSVEETLARSTATPLERCALLLACCREREFEAAVVLPSRWRTLARSAPALESLRHPILRVTDRGGDIWWIDPTRAAVTSLPPFGPGFEYFVMEGREVSRERSPVAPNRVVISGYWDLATGEAKCDGRIDGPATVGLAIENPGDLVEKWMAGWSDSTKVEVVRVSESSANRVVFSGSAIAPLGPADDRGRMNVSLPLAPLPLEDLLPHVDNPAYGSSRHVLFSEAPTEVTVVWRLRTPEEREILPFRSVEMECPGGTLSIQRNGLGREIEIAYTLVWDGRAVKPDAYREFRALLLEVIDARNTKLVLVSPEEKKES
jgi:hypothetical protein